MTAELDAIHETAHHLLAASPDPVVRFRLLRDVLGSPLDGAALAHARQGLADSRWVRQLAEQQQAGGGWGRFHSQDSSLRLKIPTTEVGVGRALALGLDASHPILQRAAQHIAGLLDSPVSAFPDRPEKNDRWPAGVRLFEAATLALIQPEHPALDETWAWWATIARRTLASGSYDSQAEIRAHAGLTGATVENSYLVLCNRYALELLSARPDELPRDIETALLSWLWRKEGGVGYLSVELASPPGSLTAGEFERWLASLELLARFPGWREYAGDAIQWLWRQRNREGCWDFGPRSSISIVLPLSESWRRWEARATDGTARVLALIQNFYNRDKV